MSVGTPRRPYRRSIASTSSIALVLEYPVSPRAPHRKRTAACRPCAARRSLCVEEQNVAIRAIASSGEFRGVGIARLHEVEDGPRLRQTTNVLCIITVFAEHQSATRAHTDIVRRIQYRDA